MKDLQIGQVHTEPQEKDAIHIAIAPVTIAKGYLYPGWKVGFHNGDTSLVVQEPPFVGIIDPFLPDETTLFAGDACWLFLFPHTITSLRHEWTHPAWKEEEVKSAKRKIKEFAEKLGYSYDYLMQVARNFQETGDWEKDNSEKYKDAPYESWRDFWELYSLVSGERVSDDSCPFSCSC